MQANQDDRVSQAPQPRSNRSLLLSAIGLVVLIGASVYYYLGDEPQPPQVEQEVTQPEVKAPEPLPETPLPTEPIPEPPAPKVEPQPEPQPVAKKPEPPKPAPLPSLQQSDDFLYHQTMNAFKGLSLDKQLLRTNLARQFVVFVDNLAYGQLARKASPLVAPKQAFSALEVNNKIYLDPDSYHRYDFYAELLSAMNTDQLIKTYRYVLPLLNDAFAELGYENDTFTKRLRQAIREMLKAPIIEQPIELTSISVNYKFKDKKLESLPNAQKLMIRMGPENSRKVKAALRKLAAEL
ncbi:DUF3014 domain-containing protein [Parashewanella tropica]|uniref:DUF3014 domain-containing protein n=1 Tax=Parashewanella tropica TaxID=2547970 RepID=UPI0010592CC0|nr:DUF3014 domain-containing protein [Parashewanella tropica]